jgi:IS5 family transposase
VEIDEVVMPVDTSKNSGGREGIVIQSAADRSGEVQMAGPPGFFDLDRRYGGLSAAGDPLERLALVVDFEVFRDELDAALARSDRAKGGRPPYDAVLMFKILVLQTLYTLSDDRRLAPRGDLGGRPGAPTEYQIRDRLSFMRFLGLALEDRVPDAKTVWLFREQLTTAGAIERLFVSFDAGLRAAGYLAMAGQIVDATVVEARRPRLSRDEKATVRAGAVPEAWSKAKRAPMDTDGRWTLKRGRKRPADRSAPPSRTVTELLIPVFGYKDHLGIARRSGPTTEVGPGSQARRHGFIRSFAVTDAATHDGGELAKLLDPDNTASSVWADTAYRSAANVTLLARRGLVPQFQRAKPRGRPMPPPIARGNASRARVRVAVEHVFAAQKCRLGLIIRTVGLARATTKLGLANLVTNMRRLAWFAMRPEPA